VAGRVQARDEFCPRVRTTGVNDTENTEVNRAGTGAGNDLNSTFEQLLGRVPSDEEKQILYRIKTALRLRDQDSIWAILMALGNFQFLYREHPKVIAAAGKANATELREAGKTLASEMLAAAAAVVSKVEKAGVAQAAALEAKTKELSTRAKISHEETQRALAEAVREGVVASARDAARAEKWKWGGLSFLAAGIFCMVTVYFAKNMGREMGRVDGKREALAICQSWKEANAWIQTVDGHAAYNLALASAGNIQLLTTCNSPGWKIIDGQCCPSVNAKGSKCWRLTPQ
jgi:hypothetical protein